jgi:hypothetical protein
MAKCWSPVIKGIKEGVKITKRYKKMIDNKKVGANKGGIAAKMQKEKPAKTWQDGCMENGFKASDKGFKRSGDSLVPRKA